MYIRDINQESLTFKYKGKPRCQQQILKKYYDNKVSSKNHSYCFSDIQSLRIFPKCS